MEDKVLTIPPSKYILWNNTFSNYNSNDILSLISLVLELLTPPAFFKHKYA